jgi:glycyl-tRNA synthetase beta chain
MVGEMPELQGLIGRYYAVNQGEHKKVCAAIEQHYLPRFAGDILPDNHVARSLALADRLDSLAGIFACGEVPTGDKDPYGLRRAALGVLRIMIEDGLALDLKQLLTRALAQFAACGRDNLNTSDKTVDQAFGFVVERLRAYYQPMGYDSSAISAVMSVLPTSPVDFDQRLRAVGAFFGEQKEAAQSLATANKRIANILSKQAESPSINVNPGMFKEKAEIALYEKVQIVAASAGKRFKKGHYRKGLTELAKLRIAVDRFFDEVMVMAEDPDIQGNRLAMLAQIRALFLQVADVSKLRIEQETDKN